MNGTSNRASRNDMLLSEHKKLSRAIVAYAESLGGVMVLSGPNGQYFDGHDVPTAAGLMRIQYVTTFGRGFVHCRFHDTDRANMLYYGATSSAPGMSSGRLNPFSSKFNFHFGRTTAAEAMDSVRHALAEFMTQPA